MQPVITAATLQEHLAYTVWASTRILGAVTQLSAEELAHDFKTADQSIVGTLAHIFAADRVWIGRVDKAPPAVFISDADRSLPALHEQWPRVHAAWLQWTCELTDEAAQANFTYQDLKGKSWTQPIWQVVLHVVNHGTHHRGQVSGFLRILGHTPPRLDLIEYYRAKIAS
jgi:uncharacterized damage-inducible protein DinB